MLPVQTMSTRQGREGEAGEALGKRSSCMALGGKFCGRPTQRKRQAPFERAPHSAALALASAAIGLARSPDSFKKRSELKGAKHWFAQSPLGPYAMDRGAKSCHPPCPGRLLAFQAGCARAWTSALGAGAGWARGHWARQPSEPACNLAAKGKGLGIGMNGQAQTASRLRLRTDFEQPFRAFAGQGRATAAPLRATAWPAPVGGRLQKP